MRNVFFGLISILVLLSCNPSGNKQTEMEQQANEQGYYGEKISGDKAISGSELLAMMQDKDSVWVTTEIENRLQLSKIGLLDGPGYG